MTKDELIDALANAGGPEVALDRAIAAITGASRPYTGSLDAALTLVPEGWYHMAGTRWNAPANARLVSGDGPVVVFTAEASTAALALCIAALKAMK